MEYVISAIQFVDDLDIVPEPNQRFVYVEGTQFIRVFTNGILVELININVVRSMNLQC